MPFDLGLSEGFGGCRVNVIFGQNVYSIHGSGHTLLSSNTTHTSACTLVVLAGLEVLSTTLILVALLAVV